MQRNPETFASSTPLRNNRHSPLSLRRPETLPSPFSARPSRSRRRAPALARLHPTLRGRCAGPNGLSPGLIRLFRVCSGVLNGPPAAAQTKRVLMNTSPGNLSSFLVCHSSGAGFCDVDRPIEFFTAWSLKWNTTAAMEKAPPRRSYKDPTPYNYIRNFRFP